jgi:hypothetical protein
MVRAILPIKNDATRRSAQNLTALKGSLVLVKKIKVVKAVPPNSHNSAGRNADGDLVAIFKVYYFATPFPGL